MNTRAVDGCWRIFAAVASAYLGACSVDPARSQDGGESDGGGASVRLCTVPQDCSAGELCNNGVCEAAISCSTDADCPGSTCNKLQGICNPGTTDGGSSTTDGGTDGGGTGGASCTTKYDCPAGKICKSRACVDPDAEGDCAGDIDCPKGDICNFAKKCEDGCVDGRDCAEGTLCHPQTFTCQVCSSIQNPCPQGQACVDQQCVAAKTCTNGPDCGNGLACVGGYCGNCETDTDCTTYGAGHKCTQGHCLPPPCTDEQCRVAMSDERGFCDLQAGQCNLHECTTNAHCTGATCNLTTHTCNQPGGGCTACPTSCSGGMVCNLESCQCELPGGGTGGLGQPCSSQSDCPDGAFCGQDPFSGAKVCQEGCVIDLISGGCECPISQKSCDPLLCGFDIVLGTGFACSF